MQGLWPTVCLRSLPALILAACLASGCGGGGSDSSTSTSTASTSSTGSDSLSSASSTGSTTGSSTTSTSSSNVVAVTVGAGVGGGRFTNVTMASVTICVPGTSTCQTIDNVMVDTGSTGLRLLASKVSLALGSVATASGGTYSECAQFADGVTWGRLVQADVRLGGETASGMRVHLLRDDGVGADIPSSCTNLGDEEDTQTLLGANGILGVGMFQQDCGSYCVGTADTIYYNCNAAGTACAPATIPLASQVGNPVASFSGDNNGVVLQLASVDDGGATSGSGYLIFGIGTRSNNTLSSTPLFVDGDTGYFTASVDGQTMSNSFIDSGSSGLFFNDNRIAQCTQQGYSGFYCPGSSSSLSLLTLTPTLTGTNGHSTTLSVKVANTVYLGSANGGANTVMNDIAGTTGSSLEGAFDFGLPFFFGRSVFTAIENTSTPYGTGPYFAWQ